MYNGVNAFQTAGESGLISNVARDYTKVRMLTKRSYADIRKEQSIENYDFVSASQKFLCKFRTNISSPARNQNSIHKILNCRLDDSHRQGRCWHKDLDKSFPTCSSRRDILLKSHYERALRRAENLPEV